MSVGWGIRVTAWRRRVTGRGIGVGARLVSRMQEDRRAVAEVKAEGLVPAGVSESVVQRPGRRPRHGGWGGGAGVEAMGWWAGGRRSRHGERVGGARGTRPGHRSLGAAGGRRVAGTQVGSGGGGHAGRGGADLSRVRERGAGARGVFF
jgi:hypothetical protein